MKMTFGRFLRGVSALSLLVAGAMVTGCGDKSSNPDAVDVTVLKAPGNLHIMDNGNGGITLSWEAAINSSDFDGFNVYGMKGAASDLDVEEGKPIVLLDTEGNSVAASKTLLENFNYDPATGFGFEKPGEKTAAEGEDAPEFEAYPIHTKPAEDVLLPTCKVDAGVCKNTTATNFGKSVGDSVTGVDAANGTITYTLPENSLKVGTSYCFFVLSSIDSGKKVSATSTNVQCIVPKFRGTFTLVLPKEGTENKGWKLTDYLAECKTAKACAVPAASYIDTVGETDHTAASKNASVFIEKSGTGPKLVAAKNSGISDLGYKAGGFADPKLRSSAPTLVIDSNTYDTGAGVTGPIFNEGGYSIAGQSVPMKKNHVYVIAVGDPEASVVTKFLYVWVWLKDDVAASPTDASVEVMMPFDVE